MVKNISPIGRYNSAHLSLPLEGTAQEERKLDFCLNAKANFNLYLIAS